MNDIVVGILDIVEDKLRECNIMLPDDDREDSKDPIVGHHYAELHDRIKKFLQEQKVLPNETVPAQKPVADPVNRGTGIRTPKARPFYPKTELIPTLLTGEKREHRFALYEEFPGMYKGKPARQHLGIDSDAEFVGEKNNPEELRWVKADKEITIPLHYHRDDVFYVRESVMPIMAIEYTYSFGEIVSMEEHYGWRYKADNTEMFEDGYVPQNDEFHVTEIKELSKSFRPSTEMPKAACRLAIRLTGTRVERLQDITDIGTVLEGIPSGFPMAAVFCPKCDGTGTDMKRKHPPIGKIAWDCSACDSAQKRFANYWDASIRPKDRGILMRREWAHNPWVLVASFETWQKDLYQFAGQTATHWRCVTR